MKQKHDELKAAVERGIVDNSRAVGKNDGSYMSNCMNFSPTACQWLWFNVYW